MGLTAGVDIGNATTEIVIADPTTTPPRPVAWDRRPTLGQKGSREAAVAAARLLQRLESRSGLRCTRVVLTPQVGAQATIESELASTPSTAPLRVLVSSGALTDQAHGVVGVGRPVAATSPPSTAPDEPVVLVATDPLGFRRTAAQVRAWLASATVVGVVLSGVESRLVASRLTNAGALPVVGGVDALRVLAARSVAMEVARPGETVRSLADPVWLAGHLAVPSAVNTRAAAAQCSGATAALVLLTDEVETPAEARAPRTLAIDDEWQVDLTAVVLPRLRPGALDARHQVRATLGSASEARAHPDVFAAPGREVVVGWNETSAARAGAHTTPGAAPTSLVLDLGGGTLDLMTGGRARTAAGCGDMLTTVVSHVLDISSGAAEWVKRGPSVRREAPQVVVDESGDRHFTDDVARPGTVGWLCTEGPAGPLPFTTSLAPQEWAQARRALKQRVIVDNLRRVATDSLTGRQVLLAGGPADDDELLTLLHDSFPDTIFGRADVAGMVETGAGLRTRWAVAYGLLVLDQWALAAKE